MDRVIPRELYLRALIKRQNNGLIKVVTGIRRCGKSYLLRKLYKDYLVSSGVKEDHIIEMAFDLYDNIEFRKASVFYPWIKAQIKDSAMYYILLDEVQLLEEFVSILNALSDRRNCDIYVTGSNAKFLSKDVITEFGGRGDEIHMFPLSFSEFMTIFEGNRYDGWNKYITYGGIPLVVLAGDDEQKVALLENLFKETYISDLVKRNKIRRPSELESLLNVLSSSIGSLTNVNKLVNTFKSINKSEITATTITKYIEYIMDAFLVEKAQRYDVKGRRYIGTPEKFYFSDLGLRNCRINFRQLEPSHLMENAIYNELRMRGWHVDVGALTLYSKKDDGRVEKKQIEVDFVASKGSKRCYIQSALNMETEEKEKSELRPLRNIGDSFKKIVITSNTPTPFYTEDGILMMNIYDFLLSPDSLEY